MKRINLERRLEKALEKISTELLAIKYVTSVGIGSYDEADDRRLKIVVSLVRESKTARKRVKNLMASTCPDIPFGFTIDGPIRLA